MLPLLLLYCCCTAACICCYVGCRGCCFLSIAAACCCLPRLPALIPTHPPTHPPNASPRAQADYALDQVEEVAEINRAAARLAKKATAAYMAAHPGERKFVAGAIGPTNKTLSVSPSVENPALRGITYDEVEQAYYEQAKALYEGGVDLFLVETIFDTGNAKAAIYALERFFEEQARGGWGCCALLLLCCCCCCCMPGGWLPVFASSGAAAADAAGGAVAVRRSSSGRQQQAQAQPAVQHPHLCTRAPALTRAPAPPLPPHHPTPPPHPQPAQGVRIPVFISGTIVDNSGRTLSGQTNEAFWNSVSHAKPMAVGLNCALGATDMKQYIANLSACADCFVFCYPNAGLPNAMGGYDQKGEEMAEDIRPFCECCGLGLMPGLVPGFGCCHRCCHRCFELLLLRCTAAAALHCCQCALLLLCTAAAALHCCQCALLLLR